MFVPSILVATMAIVAAEENGRPPRRGIVLALDSRQSRRTSAMPLWYVNLDRHVVEEKKSFASGRWKGALNDSGERGIRGCKLVATLAGDRIPLLYFLFAFKNK